MTTDQPVSIILHGLNKIIRELTGKLIKFQTLCFTVPNMNLYLHNCFKPCGVSKSLTSINDLDWVEQRTKFQQICLNNAH